MCTHDIRASQYGLTERKRIQLHPQIRIEWEIHTAHIPIRSQRQRLFVRRSRVSVRTGRARRPRIAARVRLRNWGNNPSCLPLEFSQNDTVSEIGRIALCSRCEVRLNGFCDVEQLRFFELRDDVGQSAYLALDDPHIYYRECVESDVLGIWSAMWHG